MKHQWLPGILEFLEEIGFKFEVCGHCLKVGCPEDLVPVLNRMQANGYQPLIVDALKIREANNRRQCVGGPLDGSRHSIWPGRPIVYRDAPRRWIVYAASDDGAAYFLGYETSEKRGKARARRWYTTEKEAEAPK